MLDWLNSRKPTEANAEQPGDGLGADIAPRGSPFPQLQDGRGPLDAEGSNPVLGVRRPPQPDPASARHPMPDFNSGTLGMVEPDEEEFIRNYRSVVKLLQLIYDALTGRIRPSLFVRPITVGPLRTRLRVKNLILVNTAAAGVTATLSLSTNTLIFAVPAKDTKVIALEIDIQEGTDIALAPNDGTLSGFWVAYLDSALGPST